MMKARLSVFGAKLLRSVLSDEPSAMMDSIVVMLAAHAFWIVEGSSGNGATLPP